MKAVSLTKVRPSMASVQGSVTMGPQSGSPSPAIKDDTTVYIISMRGQIKQNSTKAATSANVTALRHATWVQPKKKMKFLRVFAVEGGGGSGGEDWGGGGLTLNC